eukprot:7051841-Prorocentrum_lima.AAC.1
MADPIQVWVKTVAQVQWTPLAPDRYLTKDGVEVDTARHGLKFFPGQGQRGSCANCRYDPSS